MLIIVGAIVSYIVGSIPSGLIIAYLVKRIDIRKFGSGNIGATNVVRVVGKKWGVLTFFLDFIKGFLPVFMASIIVSHCSYLFYISIATLSVVGHNWSVFLKFKGGKGVSTSIGAVLGLCLVYPKLMFPLISAVLVWAGIFMLFRIVSLASLLGAFAFLSGSLIFLDFPFKMLSIVLFGFIVMRHKKNISNLLQNKELPF